MMDYSRNWELNQEKIREGCVTIVGSNVLTNYLCFYMAGLGLRNIRIIDDKKSSEEGEFLLEDDGNYNVISLENKLKEINNDLKIESVPLKADSALMGYPDVLLDLSNSPKSKEICTEHFYRNRQTKLLVSASTSPESGTVIFKRDKSKIAKALADDFLEEYTFIKQGNFTSGLISAIILDEMRKVVSPLKGDSMLNGKINYSLSLNQRFSFGKVSPDFENPKVKGKVLICGAGGIGTYIALNLALNGIEFDVYDGDTIERHNVARQLFYYDSLGGTKASTLKKKLEELVKGAKINAIDKYIKNTTLKNLPEYEVMVCCADNWMVRKVLNRHALETSTPLFNASVTAFSAIAEAYIPMENYCLECIYDLDKLAESPKRQSCAELQSSNVVMTNAFIGAFVAGEVMSLLHNKKTALEKRFEYYSKKGMKRKFNFIKKRRRKRECVCHIERSAGNCSERLN